MEKKKVYPKFETERVMMFNAIKKIDHPFLQAIVDANAVLILQQGEFTVIAECSILLLFVYDDSVEIECISTFEEERRKGSATKVMTALCAFADATDTVLTLRTANVTGHGWLLPNHLAVAHGMAKKNKMPVRMLKNWYERFGFIVTKHVKGFEYNMKRVPVKYWEREMKVQHTNPLNN